MVELFERFGKTDGRKSSKGNQLKWEKEGVWYKADYTGYDQSDRGSKSQDNLSGF